MTVSVGFTRRGLRITGRAKSAEDGFAFAPPPPPDLVANPIVTHLGDVLVDHRGDTLVWASG